MIFQDLFGLNDLLRRWKSQSFSWPLTESLLDLIEFGSADRFKIDALSENTVVISRWYFR
jgi:hypothetical protein